MRLTSPDASRTDSTPLGWLFTKRGAVSQGSDELPQDIASRVKWQIGRNAGKETHSGLTICIQGSRVLDSSSSSLTPLGTGCGVAHGALD